MTTDTFTTDITKLQIKKKVVEAFVLIIAHFG